VKRPRLFLSAVSSELRSARQLVASTIRTLGFDAVSQEDFPTGHGELREWLREQIDSCEGLIQLVGHTYGAEPPLIAPGEDRLSYTQFEFHHARRQKKKTWVVVIGDEYARDHVIQELDLPLDRAHPDPMGYQTERRTLQESYIASLTRDNHLRHTANNSTELENIVLRLKDELGELRRSSERQQRFLTRGVAGIVIALVLLIAGSWLGYQRLQRAVAQTAQMNAEKIRAHLRETVGETYRRELAAADTAADWQERKRLREAAETAHATRLSRIDDLATSFAEFEDRGATTDVFKELTRILTEQGVNEAVAYIDGQRFSILQVVRRRADVARERNRTALSPLLRAAALHETKGQNDQALNLYSDILATEPDWPEALHAALRFYIAQGDAAKLRTTLTNARRDYEVAHRLARQLTATDPGNTQWEADLAVSYERLGDVAVAQGRLADAARAHDDGLAIRKTLAAGDPSNTQWQADLAVSYERLGDVAVAQGKLADAARAHDDGLAIRKTLVASDPSNTKWQRDLSISYDRLGDVAVRQGKLADAARSYDDGLVIRKTMAAGDPSNTQSQRDLAVSYSKLGDVAVAQGKLADAARAYGDGLAIRKTLAASDPSNTQWQRDLSIPYDRLGDVAVRQGKLADAARAYGDGLAIARTLAARDPNNAQWQRDLAISYNKLGDLAVRQGKLPDAARAYRDALTIRKTLAPSDPSNTQWQADLAVSYERLGDVAVAQGKLADAARAYDAGLAIRKTLAASDPSHTQWQRDLSISYDRLGDVAVDQGRLADAARAYGDALAIARTLAARDPNNAQWQRDLAVSYNKLGNVAERHGKTAESIEFRKQAIDMLMRIEARGVELSPSDRHWLEQLRQKVGDHPR
jgi:tetratricopeptide (TPR) repeat protein